MPQRWSPLLPFRVTPFREWGLWRWLALVLTLGFLVLFGIFSLLSLTAIDDSTQRILQERRVIAEMAAVEIDGLFSRAFYELEKATDFAPFDPRAPGLSAESHMLAHAYGRIGTLSLGVAFLDDLGRVVLAEPFDLSPQGADWASEPYIRRALVSGQRQISAPFVDPRSGRPAVALTIPIQGEAGQVISLLTGLMDLTAPEIRDPLEKAQQLGVTGHALIVDQDGQIVASTMPGHFMIPGEHLTFYRQMLAAQETAVETVPTNAPHRQSHIMAFVSLKNVPWGVSVGGDVAETLAPVRRLRNGILLLGSLSLVAVLGTTLLGARRLVRPVKDLTHAAQRIADGNLDRPIAIREGGEIGLLAQNLETMRNRLAASFQQVQAWNDELEDRVKRRTEQLEALNATLREQEKLHRQLLARAITAQEEERMRIARELHDETGQVLASLVMHLEAIERSLPSDAPTARERLARTKGLTERAVADTRRIIADLRPSALDELGLVAAIRWCAENHLQPLGVAFELQVNGLANGRLPEEHETVLFRIVQEAIGNIARHAGANQVHLHLNRRREQVQLMIQDDGTGFDPRAVQPAQDGSQGLGLAGMQERASLLGGQVHIASQPGVGTRIEVHVPVFQGAAS